MQQDSVLQLVSCPALKVPLLYLFTSARNCLQKTHSWSVLCDQFPELVSSLQPFFPVFIHEIDTYGESIYGYKRLKLWAAGADSPLYAMSLVGFVFKLEGKSVLNLHLYNTELNPNKTCYQEPSLMSLVSSVKTPVHDHSCICLSHVASIDERLQVTESFYSLSPDGLVKISTIERTPATSCLDDGSGVYIHQMEVHVR